MRDAHLRARQGSPRSPSRPRRRSGPPPAATSATVDLGTGALVRAVGAGSLTAGPLLAIDQTGTAYAIDGSTPDLLQRLGYEEGDVSPVPQSWAELFRTGPVLSVRAAQTTVAAAS